MYVNERRQEMLIELIIAITISVKIALTIPCTKNTGKKTIRVVAVEAIFDAATSSTAVFIRERVIFLSRMLS